eukprot:333591_1
MYMYFVAILLIYCSNASYRRNRKADKDALPQHNISPQQVLQKDANDQCYFPPYCNLDTTRCNIPKVFIQDMTFERFYNDYYIPKKPVIIQFCNKSSSTCDLSSVVDMDATRQFFEWRNIASIILDEDAFEDLLEVQQNGTMIARSAVTSIEELDQRDEYTSPIYNRIHQPKFFEQVDIFNDLIGYLSTSDAHTIWPNKWVIFGVAGGGATFHIDYYFTSFWNMVISGSKYWIVMEPTAVIGVWNDSDRQINEAQDMQSFEFFDQMYVNGFLDKEYERMNKEDSLYTLYQCSQEKGDMMYLPPIYYHVTANLEQTLSVSQNLITKEEYVATFELLTDVRANRHKRLDDWSDYKMHDGMLLCVALSHYDAGLFENSPCVTNKFLNNLDKGFHDKDETNSQAYTEAYRFAEDHAQYSDFRH